MSIATKSRSLAGGDTNNLLKILGAAGYSFSTNATVELDSDPMCAHTRLITGLLISALAVPVASADNFIDVDVSLNHDSNLTRAFLSSDRYADVSIDTNVAAGRFFQLQPGRSVTLYGLVSASRFDDIDGLNSFGAGAGASYQHKFGLGAYAPSLSATVEALRHDSRGRTRDRDLVELALSYNKRLSPVWSVMAGIGHTHSEGRHDGARYASIYSAKNDILDFDEQSIFASIDYAFADQSLLTLGYTWVDGYTLSSALAPNPRLLAIARALTVDPAITAPPGRNQVVYTLKSSAHLVSLDWSKPVGRDTSFSIGYSYQDIQARRGVDYQNTRISLRLMHAL
jgi:3',5'-cyclic AMP phosphodiesterase CpdA